MDADEVAIDHMERDRIGVVLDLFDNAFVSRVKQRMCIRIVRFCRSLLDVLMCFGSGAPRWHLLWVGSLGWAVAAFEGVRGVAVELRKLCEVYIGAKGALDRLKVRTMIVSRELDAIGKVAPRGRLGVVIEEGPLQRDRTNKPTGT